MKMANLQEILLLIIFASFKATTNTNGAVVRPIRHSLTNVGSVYGSSSNGGCTCRSSENNMICSLQDGGTSVLVDGTILPLSELDGNQWARHLFTVNKTGQAYSVIGFDFGSDVDVRKLELVLFNCRRFQTASRFITVYETESAIGFPLTNMGGQNFLVDNGGVNSVGSTDIPLRKDSCDNLIRVCIPISTSAQVYYVEFFTTSSSWVVLAEATFYTESTSCPVIPTEVTSPITPEPSPTDTSTGDTCPPTTPIATMQTTTDTHTTPTYTQTSLSANKTDFYSESNTSQASTAVAIVLTILTICIITIAVLLVLIVWHKKRSKVLRNNVAQNILQLSPVTGQMENPVYSGVISNCYNDMTTTVSRRESKSVQEQEKEIKKSETKNTSTNTVEQMYAVVQKKSQTEKTKSTESGRGDNPKFPHTVEAMYSVVHKRPKKTSDQSPGDEDVSVPQCNVEEMYSVVHKKPKRSASPKDEDEDEDEDAPPLPPQSVEDMYSVVDKKTKRNNSCTDVESSTTQQQNIDEM